jgi:hypothetical protein
MKFPRPDGVSLTGGLICLGYEDNDERDLAFDWLGAYGGGSSKISEALKTIRATLDYAERHSHPDQRGDENLCGMDITLGELRALAELEGSDVD